MLRKTVFILVLLPFFLQAQQVRKISKEVMEDKIAGAWLGQLIGNFYGLPFENKFIEKPVPDEIWPYGYTKILDRLERTGGAFSDDDTDFEYIYLMLMEKQGIEPTYAQLAEAWKYHVRDRVWLANRAALGLMHTGLTPPVTGMKEYNPHWFQIDPQLINEIWAVTAPGMLDYSTSKSEWAARITNDSWGVEPTIFYGALYSAAFFENDIEKLIDAGYDFLPENGRFRQAIEDMKGLYKRYPDDWRKARQEMKDKYYYNEPEETRTIWNSILNGSCAVLALLYGNGDFQKTLDLSCAIGFDADNQAATLCGLLGVINGTAGLPESLLHPIEGWTLPFNDSYKNITRFDMPDAKITDISKRTARLAEQIILKNGGHKTNNTYYINEKAAFQPPLEISIAPDPIIHKGEMVDYAFIVSGNTEKATWEITKGRLPEGIRFDNGKFSGIPTKTGVFPASFSLTSTSGVLYKDLVLRVRGENLAYSAKEILANVSVTNSEVRNQMWYSFGTNLYAETVDVIRDGKRRGDNSVYYSISSSDNNPKTDYYGYRWNDPQTIGAIGFNIGSVEENGGWFSSINIQYQDEEGNWITAEDVTFSPALGSVSDIYRQPHFIEYFITFKTVRTTAIRIIGDAVISEHWHQKSNEVSPFTSITELSIYEPL